MGEETASLGWRPALEWLSTTAVASPGWTQTDLFTLVGFALTILGLGITIHQVRKTLTAARATQQAVTQTLGKLARDETLGLIADLQRVDRDLRAAVETGQARTLVGDRLADWRDKGYGLWQLVHDDPKVSSHVHEDLLESSKMAAELLTKLPDDHARIPAATKSVRGQVSKVCGQLATLGQQLRFDPGGE